MTPHSTDASTTKEGDIVLLDYELWAEGAGQHNLIATTRQSVAEEAKAELPAEHEFGPQPHLIGGDEFPAGIEAALVGVGVGQEVAKDFPPAQAFGERDPKLIELFSMHEISRLPEMRREDTHLDVGTILTIRGRRGRVTSLTAARVRVDFNPPFSGRTIRAKFKVASRLDEPVEKARALIELTYGRSKDFGVEVHSGTVTISIPDRTKFDLGWFGAKSRLIERIRSQLTPKKIVFTEEYETPVKKESGAKKEHAAPHATAEGGASAPGAAVHPEVPSPSSPEKSAPAPHGSARSDPTP